MVARKDVNSVYIGSNDYWQFDSDTFNDQTQFYGKAWLVPSKDIPVVDREEFKHALNLLEVKGTYGEKWLLERNHLPDEKLWFVGFSNSKGISAWDTLLPLINFHLDLK